MPKVAVILINYKDYAERFLAECRDSLRGIDYPKEDYQVFIVDNEATPETQKYLASNYPEAVALPNEKNVGWGEGNNTAIRYALTRGTLEGAPFKGAPCEYFVLLNMDTVVERDWLKELVAVAESDESIGIAQSKILLHPSPRPSPSRGEGAKQPPPYLINSLGNLTHFLGFGFCEGYGEPDPSPRPSPSRGEGIKEVGYASGSSMLVKKAVFEKVGLFDPEFFMYHDDAEISLKARLAGFKIMLAPRSVVFHKFEFSRGIKQAYYLERNRFLIIFEMYKWGTIILILPALLAMELGLIFYAAAKGLLKEKLRVYLYFFNHSAWRHLREERRRIRGYRQISDQELTKYLVGKIKFQEINNPALTYLANPIFAAYWRIVRRLIIW